MQVRCISTNPSQELLAHIGLQFHRMQYFPLTLGKEYLVLALNFGPASGLFGTTPGIQFGSDEVGINFAPLALFEVIDPRVSRHWQISVTPAGDVLLAPLSFSLPYYHDDLSEAVPEIVADFERVFDLLDAEFADEESLVEVYYFTDSSATLADLARVARQIGYRTGEVDQSGEGTLTVFYRRTNSWFCQEMGQSGHFQTISPTAWDTIAENEYSAAFIIALRPSSLTELRLFLQALMQRYGGWLGSNTPDMQPVFRLYNIEKLSLPL